MPISAVAANAVAPRATSTGRLSKHSNAEISNVKRFVSPGSARLALVMKKAERDGSDETTESPTVVGRANAIAKVKLPSRQASLSYYQKGKGGVGKISKAKELALRHQRSVSAIRAGDDRPSLIPKATQSTVISSPYRKRPTENSLGDQLSMYKVVSKRFSSGTTVSPPKDSESRQNTDTKTIKEVSNVAKSHGPSMEDSKRSPSRVQQLRDIHILSKTSSDDSTDQLSLNGTASKDLDYQIKLMTQKLEIAQQEIKALENRMTLQKKIAEKDVREQERKFHEALWERDESRKESKSLKQEIEKIHEQQQHHMDADNSALERILFLENQLMEERKRADIVAQAHESKVQSLIKERDESRSEIAKLHQELQEKNKSETALKNREVELQVKTRILESKFERELRRAEKIFQAHEAKLSKVIKQRNESRSQAASLAEELRKLQDESKARQEESIVENGDAEQSESSAREEEIEKLQNQLDSVVEKYDAAVVQIKSLEDEISSLLAQMDTEKKHLTLIESQLTEKCKELQGYKLETDSLREKLVSEQDKWIKVQETVDAAETKLQAMHFKNEDYIDEITYLKKELAVAIAHDAEEQERELQMVEELKEVAKKQQKYRAQITQLRSEQVGDKEKIQSLQEQILVQQEMVGVMKEETEENEGCLRQQNVVIQKLTDELRMSHMEHEHLAQQLQSVAVINHQTHARAGVNFDSFQQKATYLFAGYALMLQPTWSALFACLGIGGHPTANDVWHVIVCLGFAFVYRQLITVHAQRFSCHNLVTRNEPCPQIEQSANFSDVSDTNCGDDKSESIDSPLVAETLSVASHDSSSNLDELADRSDLQSTAETPFTAPNDNADAFEGKGSDEVARKDQ